MKRTPEEYETLAMNDRRGMEEMNRRMTRAMGLENAVQPKPAVKEEPAVSLPDP